MALHWPAVKYTRDAREKAWLRDLYNSTFTVLQPFFMRTLLQLFFMRTLLQPFSNRTTLNLFLFYGTVNGNIFLSSTVHVQPVPHLLPF